MEKKEQVANLANMFAAELSYQLPELKHAVFIDGSINCPDVKEKVWTVYTFRNAGTTCLSGSVT